MGRVKASTHEKCAVIVSNDKDGIYYCEIAQEIVVSNPTVEQIVKSKGKFFLIVLLQGYGRDKSYTYLIEQNEMVIVAKYKTIQVEKQRRTIGIQSWSILQQDSAPVPPRYVCQGMTDR